MKKMAACMQKALVSLRGAPCFSLLSLSILSSVCLRSPLSPAKTVRYSKRVSSGNLHVLPVRKRCSVSTVAGWERSARLALPCLSCSCVRCVDTFASCDLARVASLFLSSLRSFFFVFSVPSCAHFISRSSIFNPFNNLETPRQYPASQVRRTVLGFNLSDASKINRAGILTRPDKCHPKAPQPWVVVPVSVWGARDPTLVFLVVVGIEL